MATQGISDKLRSVLRNIDPRRSLVASAMWLIVALAVTFSIAAAVWVGSIARANVLQQHIRRLALETDKLSSDLGQALSARLDAVRAAGPLLRATNASSASIRKRFARATTASSGFANKPSSSALSYVLTASRMREHRFACR
jgi:hypothetical protein